MKAEEWYQRTVDLLTEGDWKRAIYAAGVLSHYYTDPIMPLHTGQSEREGAVHRAIEWSATNSYSELQNILVEDLGGYPEVTAGDEADWLGAMVIEGAQLAHESYDPLIDHYNLEAGKRNPREGFDQECKDRLAKLIGHATIGFARILDKAIAESGARPPGTSVGLAGFLAKLTTPLFWITRKLESSKDKAAVIAIYEEIQERGRAIESLPEDEREVRQLHAEEVLQIAVEDLADRPAGSYGDKHGQGATPRERSRRPISTLPSDHLPDPEFDEPSRKDSNSNQMEDGASDFFNDGPRLYLDPAAPIVDAPSIGPKTAARLNKINVQTVQDLFELVPDDAASALGTRHIDADTIREWQTQSYLQCTVPGLRGHDAQILAGCGIENAQDLCSMQADELTELAHDFCETDEGQRVVRGGKLPDLDEVTNWIEWAGLADQGRSAA